MEASIVDLRYKMNDVLKALDRKEPVRIFYRGKLKGTIIPEQKANKLKVEDHPFFGMSKSSKSVESEMAELRKNRFSDI